MRKVVVSEFLSLDGVMEDPGGSEGFERGGWTTHYGDPEMGKFKFEELFGSDALLLGRVTYEGFAAAWPSRSDDEGFADRINALPKYVASRTLDNLTWSNSHLVEGEVAGEIARLKEQPGQDILIYGSRQLVWSLMKQDLIDEYRLLIFPIILGSGIKLFPDGITTSLRLVDSKTYGSGVVNLTYQPADR